MLRDTKQKTTTIEIRDPRGLLVNVVRVYDILEWAIHLKGTRNKHVNALCEHAAKKRRKEAS